MMRSHHITTTAAPRRGGFFSSRKARRTPVTTTRAPRRSIFSRTKRTTNTTHHTHHTHATAVPVHHHKRHASMGDKISGAFLKLKGTLTGRPGQKAAGTRRMRGTDGRGAVHTTRKRRFL